MQKRKTICFSEYQGVSNEMQNKEMVKTLITNVLQMQRLYYLKCSAISYDD